MRGLSEGEVNARAADAKPNRECRVFLAEYFTNFKNREYFCLFFVEVPASFEDTDAALERKVVNLNSGVGST